MTKRRSVSSAAAAGVMAMAGATAGVIAVTPAAQAAACAGAVRYAPTTNTIVVTGGGSFTLTQIVRACPTAPLERTRDALTWDLAADLLIQRGSTLVLHGSRAGGDVDTLRIRSLASNRATEVQQITASYGTIDIDSTTITSWDPSAGGPDTNVALPTTAGPTGRGRAFIRAISSLTRAGIAQQSTMTIRNSTLSFLGYFGAEAYGVSYKSRGCDRNHVAVCKTLTVTGTQTNSTFDHNYMGTYAWGAAGMVFRGNTYSNNIVYGLDPHDVSTNLTIDHNRFTDNGNHGFICSQSCDKLTITNNTADHNGARPTRARDTVDGGTGYGVHGIMLHRGVTNSTISHNTVTDQPRGAGIAIFDSTHNTVTDNTLADNLFGIRVTAGSADNTLTHNTITDSRRNAILLLPGSDKAAYSTRTGRPTHNTFADNTISGTGGYGVRLIHADRNTIRGGSMSRIGGPLQFFCAVGNTLTHVTLPARQPVTVTGSRRIHSTLTLGVPRSAVAVTTNDYGTVTYR